MGAHDKLQNLFPRGENAAAVAAQLPDDRTTEKLIHAVRKAIASAPQRSGLGQKGSRCEHWRTFLADSAALGANCQAVLAFLLGALPADFITANSGDSA